MFFLNIYGSQDKDFKDQAKFITTMGPVQTVYNIWDNDFYHKGKA